MEQEQINDELQAVHNQVSELIRSKLNGPKRKRLTKEQLTLLADILGRDKRGAKFTLGAWTLSASSGDEDEKCSRKKTMG
ncbi:MAG TPA: hypothetical protein VHP11_09980 [Tepidisphaeraceae bacterium]|nr:hypothetical protein [Tepidisphaeraceae bacterium]